MNRRNFLKTATFTAAAPMVLGSAFTTRVAAEEALAIKLKGNINHCSCRGVFGKIPFDEACAIGKKLGLKGSR